MGVMHQCSFPGCKKQFDRKYNLKCHLRIHSDEKPYRCHHAHCTRSFRWKSSLNHHLMSLDHTSGATRHERKARSAKQRQQQLAAGAAAQIKLAVIGVKSCGDALATSSGNLGGISTVQVDRCVYGDHMEKDIVRTLDLPEAGRISGESSLGSVINSDIEHFNPAKMVIHRSERRPDDVPLVHPLGSERHQELQVNPLSVAGLNPPHDAPRKPLPDYLSSVHNTQALGLEGKAHRGYFLATGSSAGQAVPPSGELLKLRDDASIDSAIDQAMNCILPSSGVKKENMETAMISIRDSVIPGLNATHLLKNSRDAPIGNRATISGSTVKSHAPLVFVFEDSSPSMLLNAFSPAVDPLFGTCSIDAAGLKGF